MKKLLLAAALIVATGTITEATAQQTQLTKRMQCSFHNGYKNYHCQTKKGQQSRHCSADVSYDQYTKVLTVSLSSGSQDGRIEICPSHSGKTTIMIRPGETVRYTLGNYGRSSCTIIVSSGNTVLYSKNISNR